MTEWSDQAAVQSDHVGTDRGATAALDTPMLSRVFRTFTPARIALRRSGASIATQELLEFQLAHARARDAVHAGLEPASLMEDLNAIPAIADLPDPRVVMLHSKAPDRQTYLQRPDLGRQLSAASLSWLQNVGRANEPFELSIVVVDGLSALAVERNCAALLRELFTLLNASLPSLRVAPVCIVEQGRVAVGDEVARGLSAELVVVLIGERPGLSSPDSLGVYITWLGNSAPIIGEAQQLQVDKRIADADRNCISNIRAEGLSHREAAYRILYYIKEARLSGQTGIALKDPPPGYFELEQANAKKAQPTLAIKDGLHDEQ